MADSLCIVPSVWRHICPAVHDLAFDVSVSKPYTYLDIPKALRIQGAAKPNFMFLSMYGTQGGFRTDPVVVVEPTKGVVEISGKGWVYVPNNGVAAGQVDSFTFHLVLNSEKSADALVTISLKA